MSIEALQRLMGTALTDSDFRKELFGCPISLYPLGEHGFIPDLRAEEIEAVLQAIDKAKRLRGPERLTKFAKVLVDRLDLPFLARPEV